MKGAFNIGFCTLAIVGLMLMLQCGCMKSKPEETGHYSVHDIDGDWQIHSLVVRGTNFSSSHGWSHGMLSIFNMQSTFSNLVKSDGGNYSGDGGVVSISIDGVVTLLNDATYKGFMSFDKRTMNATMNDAGGGCGLIVAQKVVISTIYSPLDMQGTWQIHSLTEGGNIFSGWSHGLLIIDSFGNATFSGMVKSDGSNFSQNAATATISLDGNITLNNSNTFHGFMSADKSSWTYTMTDADGGHTLSVLSKVIPNITYITLDLQGTWVINGLMNGNLYGLYNVWLRTIFATDGSGSGQFLNVEASDGNNYFSSQGTLRISQSGDIIKDGDLTFHGFMSADKRVMNITKSYPVIVSDTYGGLDTVLAYGILLSQQVQY